MKRKCYNIFTPKEGEGVYSPSLNNLIIKVIKFISAVTRLIVATLSLFLFRFILSPPLYDTIISYVYTYVKFFFEKNLNFFIFF